MERTKKVVGISKKTREELAELNKSMTKSMNNAEKMFKNMDEWKKDHPESKA